MTNIQEALLEFVESRNHARFWEKACVASGDECWVWGACRDPESGYGRFGLWWNGKTYTYPAHRVALALHTGVAPEHTVVARHDCDNHPCVNPAHLLWGSQKNNIRDAIERDRFQQGERHYKAKLTEELVISVRRRVAQGEKQNAIAAELGLSKNTISKAVSGKTWRHVL